MTYSLEFDRRALKEWKRLGDSSLLTNLICRSTAATNAT
ncbi:hypothetical protein J2W17_005172 [Pseudomonas lini]|nr:hypothetical protein [Pseudomonas lini]